MQALDINFALETLQKPLPSTEQKVSTSEKNFMSLVQDQQKTNETPETEGIVPEEIAEKPETSFEKDVKEKTDSQEKKISKAEKSEEKDSETEEKKVKENDVLENIFTRYFSLNDKNVSEKKEAVPAENVQAVSMDLSEKVKTEEIPVNIEQFKWLLEGKVKEESFDDMISNAEEYVFSDDDGEKMSLQASYNLSTENPVEFLDAKESKKDPAFEKAAGKVSRTFSKKETKSLKDVITVKDLRSQNEKAKLKANPEKKDFLTQVKAEGNKAEYSVELSAQADKNILSLDGQSAASQDSAYQAMLTNELQENAGEIVKAGTVVLKDNKNGTINLILHPEKLGNVKITLELSDKVLTGHVTVSSREAYNAFQESISALKNSFMESGFDNATFDVSYSQGQEFSQQGNGSNDGNNSRQKGRSIYGEFVSENSSANSNLSDTLSESKDYSINIVA